MGGDKNLLVQGMTAWFQDLATTTAYAEGRILGPGAWFTSSRTDDGTWAAYLLWDSELIPIAEACAEIWQPGTVPPEPPPHPTGTSRISNTTSFFIAATSPLKTFHFRE